MFQANPRIHMKNQALFSSKDKSKKLKCRLLQFLFGVLRVKEGILGSFFLESSLKMWLVCVCVIQV